MWYVVNRMPAVPGDSIGVVMSAHRSEAAAHAAAQKHLRLVRRANGPQSYLPMIVVESRRRLCGHVSPHAVGRQNA